jgi:hypothetical protein
VDLDFDIRLNESNPRALQTYEAIKSGVKLGTSIGAIVRHAEKKKGGGLRIDDLELLEASIVGIPANPRSWVQYAVKSINALDEGETSSFLFDEETILKEAEDIIDTIAAQAEVPADFIAEAEAELEKAQPMADGSGGAMASCPDCGKGHDAKGCDNKFHKSTEPDVAEVDLDKEAARTRVTVTVDSDGTQEAPKSTPEHGLMDEDRADDAKEPDSEYLADTITVGTEPDTLKVEEVPVENVSEEEQLSQLFQTADFAAVVTKLQSVVNELTEKELELRKTTVERDEAKENLIVAKEIIDRIADLPVGRKTRFSGAVSDFRQKFPQYDEEFMKFLEK